MVPLDPPASCAAANGRAGIAATRPIVGGLSIRSAAALAVTLALTACAAPNLAPNPGGQTEVVAANDAETVAANREGRTGVEQVSLRANAKPDRVVCRRTEPTGSRISVRRCESTSNTDDPAEKMAHDRMLSDVEEMRMQELRRQQARQDAEAAMMRRPPQ